MEVRAEPAVRGVEWFLKQLFYLKGIAVVLETWRNFYSYSANCVRGRGTHTQ